MSGGRGEKVMFCVAGFLPVTAHRRYLLQNQLAETNKAARLKAA